VYYKPLDAEQ